MNDLDNKIAEEIDDEALFRLAEGEEREFSLEYQQSMEQLYRKARTHPKRRMKPIRRIVAIAAIITMLTGAAAAATFWEEIQQFFVMTFGQYVELQIDPDMEIRQELFEMVPEDWDSFWYPNELCGYSIKTTKSTKNTKVIIFSNDGEELTLHQRDDRNSINADNDAVAVSGIFISGNEVYAIEKEIDGTIYKTVFWTKGNLSFELYGNLSFDDLCKIADSLVLIER